ncbi:MAG: hypothetical protein IPN92_16220 [Chromatiaceae bacterium]|nr:hypothetical protein [Chromatiaceae bacterium]
MPQRSRAWTRDQGDFDRIDPRVHVPLNPEVAPAAGSPSLFRQEEVDARWVSCRRPFVVTGGELTLRMLDLEFDATANFSATDLPCRVMSWG